MAFGALGHLGEFLGHPVALELGDVVDEQHAVEMVDLVLQHRRQQTLGEDLLLLAVAIDETRAHARRPFDLFVIFGDRQAAFLIDAALFRRPDNLGIDEILRMFWLFDLRGIDDDQPDRLGELDRGEADAGRLVHCLDHVIHQLAQLVVDALDRRADEAQLRIGQSDDGAQGHGIPDRMKIDGVK